MIATGISSLYTDSTTKTTTGSSALGKDDFLKLLVTQLQNQDPLNPMDNTEFTAQLAQFSSLEELQNLNGAMETLHLSQKAIHNSQSLALIGKNVTAPGDRITLAADGADTLYYDLNADATDVIVHLYDSAGNLVASRDQGPLSAGRHTFAWDGSDGAGTLLSQGTYQVVVLAAGAAGKSVGATTLVAGQVQQVIFDGASPKLVIGDRRIDFSSIQQAEAGVPAALTAE